MRIFFNGQIIEDTQVKISPFDYGFLYGYGIFETFRSYNKHLFLWDEHYLRLDRSLTTLKIPNPYNKSEWKQHIDDLLEINQLKDAYIRITVTGGEGGIGLPLNIKEPTVLIYIKTLKETISAKNGVTLSTRRNSSETPIKLKSLNYLNNAYAAWELIDQQTEGIFLTAENYVAEGIVSNIFMVKDKIVIMPPIRETGALKGVSSQFIKAIINKIGLKIKEEFFTKEKLYEADEVFITNSISGVIPLVKIDDKAINNNRIGPLTRKLQEQYIKYSSWLNSLTELEDN